MNKKIPCLAIVIPCYNEEAVLSQTLQILFSLLTHLIEKNKIAENSFLYCVDDGSSDETWNIIFRAHEDHASIKGLRLSHNAGHQNALFAGLMQIKEKADCAISIDADLQDDNEAIEKMIDHFHQGAETVYGVRRSRDRDTFFKRITAAAFYKLIKRSHPEMVFNHADFRLLSQRVLVHLSHFEERHLFLRGLIPLLGFKTATVYYDRTERLKGESKYMMKKMMALAWDGITSFSHMPLRFILWTGVISFCFSLLLVVWVILARIFSTTVPGWPSLMIPICFMGGVQLLSIGILGEYIAKIYLEVKRRPRYIIESEIL